MNILYFHKLQDYQTVSIALLMAKCLKWKAHLESFYFFALLLFYRYFQNNLQNVILVSPFICPFVVHPINISLSLCRSVFQSFCMPTYHCVCVCRCVCISDISTFCTYVECILSESQKFYLQSADFESDCESVAVRHILRKAT